MNSVEVKLIIATILILYRFSELATFVIIVINIRKKATQGRKGLISIEFEDAPRISCQQGCKAAGT